MDTILNQKVRFYIYVVTGLGSIAVSYLLAKQFIGEAEVATWAALSAFVNGLAAYKTQQK